MRQFTMNDTIGKSRKSRESRKSRKSEKKREIKGECARDRGVRVAPSSHRAALRRAFFLSVLMGLALGWQAGLVGCGGRADIYDKKLHVDGPMVVGNHLVYLDKTRERVVVVRPFTGEVRHMEVGRRPVFMAPSTDESQLLVLCKGWVAQVKGEEDEAPSLHRIELSTGEAEVYLLESPFDEVAVSQDDRHAVAFFSATVGPGMEEVFRNPNAVAILDLDSGEVVHKTVRSFGDVPRGVMFSPADMTPVGPDGTLGTPRTLAVVFAEGYLTFLDITHPERREITVQLTLPEMDSQNLVGEQLVFVPSAGNAFLRVTTSSDIYTFTFMTREPQEAWQNDFVISVNTLASGSVPGDIAVYDDGGEQKVLVANYSSRDVTVIDAYTSQFDSIPMGAPVNRILLHPEVNPVMALVYCKGYPQYGIHFLDLSDLEEEKGRNLETLHATEPVLSVERIQGRNKFLVVHDDNRSVMSVLDPEERTLSPLTAHSDLWDYAVNSSGTVLAGFTGGSRQLGLVDMTDLSIRTLMLARDPHKIFALRPVEGEDLGQEMNTLVVDHGMETGFITVIPNPTDAQRTNTFVMAGFMLKGLFNDDPRP